MATKRENLKSLFSNTRTRVIILFTAVLLIIAVIIGFIKIKSSGIGPDTEASMTQGPAGIRSIPGVLNPTPQYAKIQEEQNINQAQKAEKSGGSAIPTIIRTQTIGPGVGVIGSEGGKGGVGFTTLSQENQGPQRSSWIESLKNGNCSKQTIDTIVSEGAQLSDLTPTCTCLQLKDVGYELKDLNQVCSCKELKAAGFNARQFKDVGYTAGALHDCGFDACESRNAGYTAQDMKDGHFSDGELKGAGYSDDEIKKTTGLPPGITDEDIKNAGCDPAALSKLRQAGVRASDIRRISGCSAEQLKAAGYSAKELRDAGFSAKDLKDAGFTAKDLKDAGFTAVELKNAGFSAADLKNAGFSAKELKDAGFTAAELKAAGFTAKDLKDAGFSAAELKNAGFTDEQLKEAGFALAPSNVAGMLGPNGQPLTGQAAENAANAQELQGILNRQTEQMAEQKYQQQIQQRTSDMLSAANQSIQGWKAAPTQVYTEGNPEKQAGEGGIPPVAGSQSITQVQTVGGPGAGRTQAIVKTGDILFAVLDTSVNSDEPGPILATIVSGKLKGTKLIGSFNLPANADKMVITFNTMSVPGAAKTTSISAFAVDPNTARTALSSKTNHHYLMRYGSLFAASFLQGFGNAFQSANTTVTIGGTGGGNNVTVQNGIGRSTLQNAVIGLATVGKSWGQQAQLLFNTPTTVQVYAGTGIGVLFTQDIATI